MLITLENVFPILAETLPQFTCSDPDWVADQLSYLFLSDMVRYVCNRAYPEFEPEMEKFAALIEKLAVEGDTAVLDLVHDALETLCEHREDEERDLIATHFGPKTLEMWEDICRI